MKFRGGLLGPEKLSNERRTRKLGIGAAVRAFNDLAVPGLGGVWFGKQLFMAVLGVAVAERVRNDGKSAKNIETANAIEALACWLAFNRNGWQADARIRGKTKMQGKNDLTYTVISKPSFYVTQPMRMATVQPLLALGLVIASGERFNAFACSPQGHAFIDAACSDIKPFYRSQSILEYLGNWVKGQQLSSEKILEALTHALSPVIALPSGAREVLREVLIQGIGEEGQRRRTALAWVEGLRNTRPQSMPWTTKPDMLTEAHWHDLHAGALFFMTRDAAIKLLDQVESYIASQNELCLSLAKGLPDAFTAAILSLRIQAQQFLAKKHDPTPDKLARKFCEECANTDDILLLTALVKRDDRVLRLHERSIVPGPAFKGKQSVQDNSPDLGDDDHAENGAKLEMLWPDAISHRIRNLFSLNLDLHGELNQLLKKPSFESDHEPN